MILLNSVEKIYKNEKNIETPALRGVSVQFGEKGLVFILGKSGSGKTTLLNLIGGIDQPTSGEIVFNGKSSKDFSQMEYDSYRNACVGFIFQEYNLLSDYSVGQNVAFALELQGRKFDRDLIEDILRQMELRDDAGNTLFDRKITELSGGQKQRVAIARALVKNPNVILADEPSGALDSKTGESIYDLLKKISKERLVIVVSHDEMSAKKYADRILQIADGQIIDDTEILNNEPTAQTAGFKPIKAGLSFKRIFMMGAHSLKYKKVRLVISTFLSIFMCFIFGIALTAATCDVCSTQLKILYDNDVTYVVLKENSYRLAIHPNGSEYKNYYVRVTSLQRQGIEEYFGFAPLILKDASNHYEEGYQVSPLEHLAISDGENLEWDRDHNPYIAMLFRNCDAVMEVNSAIAEYADLVPDARLLNPDVCHLPNNFLEIAISDAKADLFMRYGYKDANGNIYPIATPDDLIGKKLGYLTICGVYSTGENRAALQEQYDKEEYWYDKEDSYVSFVKGTHIMNLSFVLEGYALNLHGETTFNDSTDLGVSYLAKLTGNRYADRAFFDDRKITYDDEPYHYSLKIASPYSDFVESAASLFVEDTFLTTMWIVGSIFALASVLMFMNYLNVSIEFRKRELGILRALGATKKEVILICLVESLIITAIVFVLALIATIIWSVLVNAYYGVPLFFVGIIPIISLFLLCFGIAFLATILPVHRISKRKPVDIINGK